MDFTIVEPRRKRWDRARVKGVIRMTGGGQKRETRLDISHPSGLTGKPHTYYAVG